jgi:hypothetical protein
LDKGLTMTNPTQPDIIVTKVDEAPQLASASLLPIIRSFAAAAGVSIGTRDGSLPRFPIGCRKTCASRTIWPNWARW